MPEDFVIKQRFETSQSESLRQSGIFDVNLASASDSGLVKTRPVHNPAHPQHLDFGESNDLYGGSCENRALKIDAKASHPGQNDKSIYQANDGNWYSTYAGVNQAVRDVSPNWLGQQDLSTGARDLEQSARDNRSWAPVDDFNGIMQHHDYSQYGSHWSLNATIDQAGHVHINRVGE
jgi:hypothetical protein